MLSLRELERAARIVGARWVGHRVQAVLQPDPDCVVLTLYGDGSRTHLRLSCRPGSARVSRLASPPPALPAPPAFAQYLRAHALGARMGGVRLLDGDRQLALRLDAAEGTFELLLQIFGRRSNLYVLQEGAVLAALRPLRETRSELSLGELWRSPEGRPPIVGEDRFADVSDEDFLDAVEAAYADVERDEIAGAAQRRVERGLRREARRLDRKLEKLAGELDRAREASRLGREGELLKGALSSIRRGDTCVTARDFETGEEVVIALDPTLSPGENLDRVFRRYQKSLRSLQKAGAQEGAVRAARAELTALEEEFAELVGGGADAESLAAFAARTAVERLLPKSEEKPARRSPRAGDETRALGKQRVPARLAPRRYATAGDLEIWVGRSAAGNDYLSLRLARGKDLFFHLDGAPGSHVILRTGGRGDPPSEAVLDACELAVHFSKFKNASRADVHVVPIANVRKPRGAKPGLVTVHGGRTVHLRRVPKRLERVLAARIED